LAKEAIMKYVVAWKTRSGGSAAENEASAARLLEVYSKWTPPSDVTFHQFVARVDGEGGFAVTEGDDPASAARDIFKLAPYLEYTVYPVIDVGEAAGFLAEAVEWRKSITS
jgi:Protein of unknown function (DUF3303)